MKRRLGLMMSLAAAYAQPAAITFNKHIAPIVFTQCAPCHRPGEAAPFSLLTYQDVKKHARQIAAVTKSRFMPPWLPDPNPIQFAGQFRLTNEQITLIERWVEQGAQEGSAADLPPRPKFTEGWQLGEPDLILKIPRPFTLRPDGPDEYRNIIFPYTGTETRYVRALEIRPGNKRVVHHANLLIDRNRSSRWRDGRDGQPGFPGMDLRIEANLNDPESHFLFWKPGTVLSEETDGMAWTLDPGSDLILNMHLQPTGKPESIEPSLGIYFTNQPPRLHPMLVQLENDRALDIPPGTSEFTVTDDFTLPVDCDLLGVYPHAHYLGKDILGEAALPDGSRKTLIRIRHWNVNWQAVYRYEKPVFLPKGTKLSMRWIYDNTAANPANPNHPPKRVITGDQATDEMAHLWLQLLPRGPGDRRIEIEEAQFRKRVRRDPSDFTAHFNLGGALQASGNRDAAIGEFQTALRIRPRDEVAHNTLGAVFELQNRPDDAEAQFRAALDARPDYPDAHYNLATLLLASDRLDEAIPHLREVLRLQPDDLKAKETLAEALNTRAHALGKSGRLKEAAADFRELLALTPNDSDTCTNLGVALAMQGDIAGARDLFERAIVLNPANEVARKNLEKTK
ncbi:MAG: tetratricopeptide repeat protein [Bryobacteraceae bacterium]|jgi:Flp pilus assembly protein TadD